MGIILLVILFMIIVGGYVFWGCMTNKDASPRERRTNAIEGFVTSSTIITAIFLMILITIMSSSYVSYLGIRSFYDGTIEQYRGAITVYEEKAVIDMIKGKSGHRHDKSVIDRIYVHRSKISGISKTHVLFH